MSKEKVVDLILFFSGHDVVKEMLMSEFDAILDGIVSFREFANQHIKAVLVTVDTEFNIHNAIYFYIEFDSEGSVDESWNVPFRQLINAAEKGPDLGAGPIRLVCESNCPIAEYEPYLWDPSDHGANSELATIAQLVRTNKNVVRLVENISAPSETKTDSVYTTISETANSGSDKLATLLTHNKFLEKELEITKYRLDESEKVKELVKNKLIALEGRYAQREKGFTELSALFQVQKQNIDKLRSLLKKAQVHIEQIKQDSEHKQQHLEQQYKAALVEKSKQMQTSGLSFVQSLADAGMKFVAYHRGLGHITVAATDMQRYASDPNAFAAEKNDLVPAVYKNWLAHIQQPICQAILPDGSCCSAAIEAVTEPKQFRMGISDRCALHRV